MAPRKKLELNNLNENEFEELVEQYGENKALLDDYKKICDTENARIKQYMEENNLDSGNSSNYIVTYKIQKRETMNEEKLLEIAHIYGIQEIVKIREYIDFDALESAIYNNKISQDILLEMDKAREVKEVPTLRISKKKEKK